MKPSIIERTEMTSLTLQESDITYLKSEFQAPIKEIVLAVLSSGVNRPLKVFLKLDNGKTFCISSKMIEISERVEVGRLVFDEEYDMDNIEREFDIFSYKFKSHFSVNSLSVLKLKMEDAEYESGFNLKAEDGREIAFLPGDYPYTIYSTVAHVLATHSIPEYSLDRYTHETYIF